MAHFFSQIGVDCWCAICGTNSFALAAADGEGKPLGKWGLDCVAWRARSLSARLFQPLLDLASQFDRVSMPAFLQRQLSSLAHPPTKPIGDGLTGSRAQLVWLPHPTKSLLHGLGDLHSRRIQLVFFHESSSLLARAGPAHQLGRQETSTGLPIDCLPSQDFVQEVRPLPVPWDLLP
jgi:hypothetical protein